MALRETTIKAGDEERRFRIQVGNFVDCSSLKLALIKALKESGIKIDLSGWNLDGLKTEIGDISFVTDAALGLLSNTALEKALMTLGKNCVIGDDEKAGKITPEFFEPVENRKFYYPVMGVLLKENLAPFFEGLSLSSLIPPDLLGKIQGLMSQQES